MRSEDKTRIIQGDKMDEKKNNIRLVRTGGRKVAKNTTEYDNTSDSAHTYATDMQSTDRKKELEKRVRYQKRQKAQRLKMQRRRALVIFILVALLVVVLLFMTPIFNIRSVSVEGNSIVTAEQFQEKLKPLIGENLFRTGEGKIEDTLKSIPFIESVDVQKKMFPPSVKVVVTEYVPAALITVGDKSMLVNSQLRVLADNDEQAGLVPYVTGLNVQSCEVGGILKSDSEEKDEIAITALKTFEITGILDEVIDINISDTSNIMINYDNRINVKCGSKLNLDRKLRLFKESVKSSSLTENSRGTMDLSESGKAVYTP